MIKISHECPTSLMKDSRIFNDYDYALVHLFEQSASYYYFFKESLSKGREVILDNSIFELGEAFNTGEYLRWIRELQPTWVIAPDVLEDGYKTVENAKDFKKQLKDWCPDSKLIGVAQGSNFGEFIMCYKQLIDVVKVDMVAIPFDFSWFKELFPAPSKRFQQMGGRMRLLQILNDQMKENPIPHHLLGCSLPQEFLYYSEHYPWIYSLDTSNPVVTGIKGIEYSVGGERTKPEQKLHELISFVPNQREYSRILNNIRSFRSIVNPGQVQEWESESSSLWNSLFGEKYSSEQFERTQNL